MTPGFRRIHRFSLISRIRCVGDSKRIRCMSPCPRINRHYRSHRNSTAPAQTRQAKKAMACLNWAGETFFNMADKSPHPSIRPGRPPSAGPASTGSGWQAPGNNQNRTRATIPTVPLPGWRSPWDKAMIRRYDPSRIRCNKERQTDFPNRTYRTPRKPPVQVQWPI
jgi:hypothetical protein